MDLLGPLYRAHALLRLVLVALACVVNALRFHEVASQPGVVVGCVVMAVWTVATSWMYLTPRRRTLWVFVADLCVTVALVVATVVVVGAPADVDGPAMALPAYWIAGAPLAIALWRGWLGGLISSGVVALVAIWSLPVTTPWGWGNLAVLVIACVSVGYITGQLRQTTGEREQMYAVAAALGERQRLARVVHDGVLQVLAMVERDGQSLGPRGTWLAHQAHEQELALRSLLQDTAIDFDRTDSIDETHADLAALLDRHSNTRVTVSTPAGRLMVEAHRAREVDAAVSEALTNVARHAGPDARAWVLLEREGNDLLISIRDNGVGATPQVFEEAVRRGRMGTSQSIYGRLRDLGGHVQLHTAPGRGLEWEFRVPYDR